MSLFTLIVTGCTAEAAPATTDTSPDYTKSESWSIITATPDKPVDVFFMHPTTYGDESDGPNASRIRSGLSKSFSVVDIFLFKLPL